MTSKPALGFIGSGRVAQVFARLLAQQGYIICAVHSRTPSKAAVLADQVGAVVMSTPSDVIECAELTIMAVTDDAIDLVANAAADRDWHGKWVVHTSGVHNLHSLDKLHAAGAQVGSLHPAYPFASVERALIELPGATFAVEASTPELQETLAGIVKALNGQMIVLTPDHKALYHTSLVLASNYAVTLYATAEKMLHDLGASASAASGALNALVGATLRNLETIGIPDALTGPLVRGDVGTIEAHLAALSQYDPQLKQVYIQLMRLTYPVLQKRGINTDSFNHLLQQDENRDASHNT